MNKLLNRMYLLLLSMILYGGVAVRAQVNMLFNPAIGGRDMRGLSFLQVMNTSGSSCRGYLNIEIRGASGAFVKVSVPTLDIRAGSTFLSPGRMSGAAISYSNSEEGNYTRQTGLMPEGELEYCFRLTVVSKDKPDEVYENCFYRTNIISSPMTLVLPDNGDSFCDKRPRFTWQPPLPLVGGMVFDLKLVVVNPGQTAGEALKANTPVIYQSNIKGTMLPFPSGVPDLKEGQQYAWQVTAGSKTKQVVSEIWQFTIGCEKNQPQPGSFRELKDMDDGGFLSTGSSLRFAVYNSFIEGKLQYKISDLSNTARIFRRLPEVNLERGSNNITIDLNKIPGIVDDREYLLSVVLPDGKKVSVRFKYDDSHE